MTILIVTPKEWEGRTVVDKLKGFLTRLGHKVQLALTSAASPTLNTGKNTFLIGLGVGAFRANQIAQQNPDYISGVLLYDSVESFESRTPRSAIIEGVLGLTLTLKRLFVNGDAAQFHGTVNNQSETMTPNPNSEVLTTIVCRKSAILLLAKGRIKAFVNEHGQKFGIQGKFVALKSSHGDFGLLQEASFLQTVEAALEEADSLAVRQ